LSDDEQERLEESRKERDPPRDIASDAIPAADQSRCAGEDMRTDPATNIVDDAWTHDIGARIRQYRLAAGMSQSVLALRCGVRQPELSLWENGERRPQGPTLQRLALALGVTWQQLVAPYPADPDDK